MSWDTEDIVWIPIAVIGAVLSVFAAVYGMWLVVYLIGILTVLIAIHEARRLLGYPTQMVSADELVRYRAMPPGQRLRYQLERSTPASNLAGSTWITGAILIFALDEGYSEVAWFCVPLVVVQALMLGVLLVAKKDKKTP